MLHPERTGTRAKRPEKAVAHVRRGGRAAHARMTREKLLPQGYLQTMAPQAHEMNRSG